MPIYIEKESLSNELQALKDKASELCKKYDALAEHDKWDKAVQAYRTVSDVVQSIDALPTVDAEPVKHGHWEWTDDPRTGDFVCSNCLDHNIVRSRYCPYCGAKMDE